MNFTSIGFLFDEAAKNIRRNGLMSLAALSTVAIAMAVLGGALYFVFRLHQFVEVQPRQFEIEVFMRDGVERDDTMAVKRKIQQLPGVAHVSLYSKESALAELEERDRSAGTQLTKELESNPLPDRLDVRLTDPNDTAQITKALRDPERFPAVHEVKDAQDTLNTLFAIQRVVRNVGGIASIMLFIATGFVIQNTIRLTVLARRREIRVMQLVGATPGFIRLPLVLEGIFYGVMGSLMASGVVLLIVSKISSYTGQYMSPLAQDMPKPVGFGMVALLLAGIGMAIGWLGSVLSIRRFLKRV